MIVLCHGVYDILHIGHFRHLREARGWLVNGSGKLVVSITAAEYVDKGPGRPAHTDAERCEQLRACRFVDEVYVCKEPTAITALLEFRPHVFAKGIDYADRGIRAEEADACRILGTEVRYTMSDKRSVSELTSRFNGGHA